MSRTLTLELQWHTLCKTLRRMRTRECCSVHVYGFERPADVANEIRQAVHCMPGSYTVSVSSKAPDEVDVTRKSYGPIGFAALFS